VVIDPATHQGLAAELLPVLPVSSACPRNVSNTVRLKCPKKLCPFLRRRPVDWHPLLRRNKWIASVHIPPNNQPKQPLCRWVRNGPGGIWEYPPRTTILLWALCVVVVCVGMRDRVEGPKNSERWEAGARKVLALFLVVPTLPLLRQVDDSLSF
jgi:hypothetical protein